MNPSNYHPDIRGDFYRFGEAQYILGFKQALEGEVVHFKFLGVLIEILDWRQWHWNKNTPSRFWVKRVVGAFTCQFRVGNYYIRLWLFSRFLGSKWLEVKT